MNHDVLQYHLSCAVRASVGGDPDIYRALCAIARGAREARDGEMHGADLRDIEATRWALSCV